MANSKQTSKGIGTLAAKTLQSKGASQIQKSLAGAALSQKSTTKQTGATMEDVAAKVLKSEKYSPATKKLAGSVLSQSNKKR